MPSGASQYLIGDVVDVGEDQIEVVVAGSGYQLGDETRCRREGFTPQNADIFARLDVLSDGLRELRSSGSFLSLEHHPVSVAAASLYLLAAAPPEAAATGKAGNVGQGSLMDAETVHGCLEG